MISPKKQFFIALIFKVIDHGLTLLRYAAARRSQVTAEQTDRFSKIRSSVTTILQQALAQGHTCLPIEETIHLLLLRHKDWSESDVSAAIHQLSLRGDISWRCSSVSLPQAARAEETIAHRLRYIGRRLPKFNYSQLEHLIGNEADGLNDEQREAVSFLASSSVAILTGDPGTGKTVTIKALTAVLERAGYVVHLTAPTGRAAARLTEETGRPAQTLHRLLHNNHRQQSVRELIFPKMKEAVIVDEASMLDLFLAERLVEFCTSRTKLILVGDIHQLHPVGPGQVFRDLIESGRIPSVELTSRFRQSDHSSITITAHQIKSGVVPELVSPGEAKSDCYFIEADNVFEIQRLILNAATHSLPKNCGANPQRDIQILTPMHKGPLGTVALNQLIRNTIYQEPTEAYSPKQSFQPNDRVIQIKNNYHLGVFNGECGAVEEVSDDSIAVRFGEQSVIYDRNSLIDLAYGYAITIHRSQGSEYPFVIIPIHESQGVMLSRELLYTALTRARQMVVLIGSRRALEQAIKNSNNYRNTGLKDLLNLSIAPFTFRKAA